MINPYRDKYFYNSSRYIDHSGTNENDNNANKNSLEFQNVPKENKKKKNLFSNLGENKNHRGAAEKKINETHMKFMESDIALRQLALGMSEKELQSWSTHERHSSQNRHNKDRFNRLQQATKSKNFHDVVRFPLAYDPRRMDPLSTKKMYTSWFLNANSQVYLLPRHELASKLLSSMIYENMSNKNRCIPLRLSDQQPERWTIHSAILSLELNYTINKIGKTSQPGGIHSLPKKNINNVQRSRPYLMSFFYSILSEQTEDYLIKYSTNTKIDCWNELFHPIERERISQTYSLNDDWYLNNLAYNLLSRFVSSMILMDHCFLKIQNKLNRMKKFQSPKVDLCSCLSKNDIQKLLSNVQHAGSKEVSLLVNGYVGTSARMQNEYEWAKRQKYKSKKY